MKFLYLGEYGVIKILVVVTRCMLSSIIMRHDLYILTIIIAVDATE